MCPFTVESARIVPPRAGCSPEPALKATATDSTPGRDAHNRLNTSHIYGRYCAMTVQCSTVPAFRARRNGGLVNASDRRGSSGSDSVASSDPQALRRGRISAVPPGLDQTGVTEWRPVNEWCVRLDTYRSQFV